MRALAQVVWGVAFGLGAGGLAFVAAAQEQAGSVTVEINVSTDSLNVAKNYCGIEAVARIVAGRTGQPLQSTYDGLVAALPDGVKKSITQVGCTPEKLKDVIDDHLKPKLGGPAVITTFPPPTPDDEFSMDDLETPPIGQEIRDALLAGDDVIVFIEQGTNISHWAAITGYSGTAQMAAVTVTHDSGQGDDSAGANALTLNIGPDGQDVITWKDGSTEIGDLRITKIIRVSGAKRGTRKTGKAGGTTREGR